MTKQDQKKSTKAGLLCAEPQNVLQLFERYLQRKPQWSSCSGLFCDDWVAVSHNRRPYLQVEFHKPPLRQPRDPTAAGEIFKVSLGKPKWVNFQTFCFSWSWSRRRPKTVRSSTAPEPSLAWPPSSRWEETQAQSYCWIIISPFNGGLQH